MPAPPKAVMKISAGCLNEHVAPLRPRFLTAYKNTQVKEIYTSYYGKQMPNLCQFMSILHQGGLNRVGM